MQILVELSRAMVNKDIFEGLKSGLERGQTLKRAMLSFFNANYNKNEIEEAARELSKIIEKKEEILSEPIPGAVSGLPKKPILPSKQIPLQKPISPIVSSMPQKPEQQKKSLEQKSVQEQKVSNYDSPKSNKLLIIILISILVVLVGIFVTIFLLREKLIQMFTQTP